MKKAAPVVLLMVALMSQASAQCDVYNSSVDIEKDEFGVFLQDRIGCALTNLLSPGSVDTIVILFFVLVVVMLFYALLARGA